MLLSVVSGTLCFEIESKALLRHVEVEALCVLLCAGTQVYKGLWRGTVVAIKTMILPANMSGAQKREKMAIMEVGCG